VHFFPQKVDDLFLVVVLTTQPKTAILTTSTLQLFPAQQNFPHKFAYLLHLGMYLQLTPINFDEISESTREINYFRFRKMGGRYIVILLPMTYV